jgi:hypothetical protein
MAVPRPVMLGILGLALIAGAFLVTRSGSSQSVTQATKSPQPAVPVKPVKPLHPIVQHAPARTAPHAPAVAHKVKPHVARPAAPADVEVAEGAEAAAKALTQGKVVVFFFTKPGSADDAATAAAVHSLRGMNRVAVFDANLAQIADYRPMLQGVGISQIPAVVVVRPGQRAVLFQGYVDPGTLRQNVADAQR